MRRYRKTAMSLRCRSLAADGAVGAAGGARPRGRDEPRDRHRYDSGEVVPTGDDGADGGDPVNLLTGVVWRRATDIAIPCPGSAYDPVWRDYCLQFLSAGHEALSGVMGLTRPKPVPRPWKCCGRRPRSAPKPSPARPCWD